MKYISQIRKKQWQKLIIAAAIVVAVFVFTAVQLGRHIYLENLKPLSSTTQKSVSVTIPRGASLKDVGSLLKRRHIIRSDLAFDEYVRNQNASDKIKAGTYDLSPSQGVREIVAIITEGKVATNLITILPGLRIDQVKKIFVQDGFSESSVNTALNANLYRNYPALADLPSNVTSLEGYLYPESFQKTSETTPQDIVRKSLDEMQKRLTPEIRSAIEHRGLSVHQGIILASLIEQEANKQADRNQVAQVFFSRLQDGIKLESDVTAFYGAILAGKPLSVAYNSAYNTYFHGGLPTGPISNVTDSSLQAVAHPAKTSYLYFVAGDDGTVYFSATKAEHEAQISQYCRKLCPTP